MANTLYRNDTCYGAGVISLFDIIYYELTELGNQDIIDYCLCHYNLSESTKDILRRIEGMVCCYFENNTAEWPAYEVLFIKNGITLLLEEISLEAGFCVKYGIWLADKETIIECYDGNDDNISEYEVSSVLLSDLVDGKLFGYENPPQPIF